MLEITYYKIPNTNQQTITYHLITQITQLQKRLEEGQGRIQFNINTSMEPPSGRRVYDYTNRMWIPTAALNPKTQCLKGRKKQNRVDILDWTLEIREVSLNLNQ